MSYERDPDKHPDKKTTERPPLHYLNPAQFDGPWFEKGEINAFVDDPVRLKIFYKEGLLYPKPSTTECPRCFKTPLIYGRLTGLDMVGYFCRKCEGIGVEQHELESKKWDPQVSEKIQFVEKEKNIETVKGIFVKPPITLLPSLSNTAILTASCIFFVSCALITLAFPFLSPSLALVFTGLIFALGYVSLPGILIQQLNKQGEIYAVQDKPLKEEWYRNYIQCCRDFNIRPYRISVIDSEAINFMTIGTHRWNKTFFITRGFIEKLSSQGQWTFLNRWALGEKMKLNDLIFHMTLPIVMIEGWALSPLKWFQGIPIIGIVFRPFVFLFEGLELGFSLFVGYFNRLAILHLDRIWIQHSFRPRYLQNALLEATHLSNDTNPVSGACESLGLYATTENQFRRVVLAKKETIKSPAFQFHHDLANYQRKSHWMQSLEPFRLRPLFYQRWYNISESAFHFEKNPLFPLERLEGKKFPVKSFFKWCISRMGPIKNFWPSSVAHLIKLCKRNFRMIYPAEVKGDLLYQDGFYYFKDPTGSIRVDKASIPKNQLWNIRSKKGLKGLHLKGYLKADWEPLFVITRFKI